MENKLQTTGGRNYGVDLLRIVSMLMIAALHIMGHGGVLNSLEPLSLNYEVAWFIEVACYGAVNCYALISGYVGCCSKTKYSNIATIWLQVVFYSVIITAITAKLTDDVTIVELKNALLPISKGGYWYFTAYFCVFFFIPLMNKAIEGLNARQLRLIGITLFLLLSVLPTAANADIFYTKKGYSALWLAVLYILGGIIRKCDFLSKIKVRSAILIYLICVVITWGEKYAVEVHNTNAAKEDVWTGKLLSYISPTVLVSAVMLLIIFSKLKTGKIFTKIIGFFAPLTFGVYLIHDNGYVRSYIIKNTFAIEYNNVFMLIGVVLCSAVGIFIICSLIDYVRSKLFEILRIKKCLSRIEVKLLGDLWTDNRA